MIYSSLFIPLSRALPVLFLPIALAACSAGDNNAGPASTDTNITRGILSDAPSVTVNGRAFGDDEPLVFVDNESVGMNQLAAGMMVTVQSRDGIALDVHYEADVKGPLDVQFPAGSLSVMGQRIDISAATRFDDNVGNIVAGDVLEVSGMRDADDAIVASFVERKTKAPKAYEVRGTVRDLDSVARTFRIGDLVVDYGQARLDDFIGSAPVNGDQVEVKDETLGYEPGSLWLLASKVEPQTQQVDDGFVAEYEIEGIITAVLAENRFALGSLVVRTADSTRFRDGTREDVRAGARIKVKGQIDELDELVARDVKFTTGDDKHNNTSAMPYGSSDDNSNGGSNDDSNDSSDDNSNDGSDDNSNDSSDDNSNGGSDDDSNSGSNGGSNDNRGDHHSNGQNETDRGVGSDIRIEGLVGPFDALAGTLVVGGFDIITDGSTTFENRAGIRLNRASFFALLHTGETLVKVQWKPFVGYDQAAHEIEIED